jgi:sialic acid synthase SpsE
MKIAGRTISRDEPPLIIAELGINHGGCLETAKKMVLMAAQAGCECVKHQTHFVEDEMTEEAKKVFPPNADKSIWDVIANASLTKKEEVELKTFAEGLGLIYISTPFSRSAADFLNEIDIPAFKIGSGELDNLPLLRHIAQFGKPIIMSTGMHSFESIERSVEILASENLDYALLECTSAYPARPESIRLSSISELQKRFPGAVVGFSDHSMGPTMSIAATALGARIIERHFTDTRYREGPDIICSMDPAELRYLVDRLEEVHIAMKVDRFRTSTEASVYEFARSSIVADRDLRRGDILTTSDIWARRPGTGEIPGYEFDEVVGKKLTRNLPKNTQLRWQDLTE